MSLLEIKSSFQSEEPSVEVSTVILQKKNHFLLLKRNNDKSQGGKWSVPGGKKELAETPIETALRELHEETGIKLKSQDLIFRKSYYLDHSEYFFKLHIFSYQVPSDFCDTKIKLGAKEHTEFGFFTFNELMNMDLIIGQKEVFSRLYGKKD